MATQRNPRRSLKAGLQRASTGAVQKQTEPFNVLFSSAGNQSCRHPPSFSLDLKPESSVNAMPLVHPYRLSNDELSVMTDAELLDYIDQMESKLGTLKGYGRKQYQKEITRAKKMLRTTEIPPSKGRFR